jgi:hypothetical protein
MRENETMAFELVAALRAVGIESRAEGGTQGSVDVAPVQSRALLIHCFWYDRNISGLMLGMNPANARGRQQTSGTVYEGPEYLVYLKQAEVNVAGGRTRSKADVIACALAWCQGHTLTQLATEVPFIDSKARSLRALTALLIPGLHCEFIGDPIYKLWVHAEDRSCHVSEVEGEWSCSFRLLQAEVAYSTKLCEVPAAIATWLKERVSLEALARVPGVELEPHAALIEQAPARWHWLHVRDRIANPNDVLAPLRPLIEALADSPVASTFYSFSSLDRFCFSASSHYPWIAGGLPVVAPRRGGDYIVDNEPCTLNQAVQQIEKTLASYPIQPFFGSAYHFELSRLDDCFARLGSSLRGHLVPRDAWYSLAVSSGTRTCLVSGYCITFKEGSVEQLVDWPTIEDAACWIHRWLQEGASHSDISSDPKAKLVISELGPK